MERERKRNKLRDCDYTTFVIWRLDCVSVKHSTSIEDWYERYKMYEKMVLFTSDETNEEEEEKTHAECKGKGDTSHLLQSQQ